ncbi:hypothetical protein BG000_010991 [Podila horticola]|nr:hypothetical protein BG000_010991 [Podila horticola]
MAMGDFTMFIAAGAILFVAMLFCYYMSEKQKKDVAASMALVAAARHMTVILPMTSPDTLPAYTPRFVIVAVPSDTPPSYEPQSNTNPQPEANGESSLPTQGPTMEQQQAPTYSESTSVPPPSSSSPLPQQAVAASPA